MCAHPEVIRSDDVHPYKRRCLGCGAIGWLRNRTFVVYRCKRKGCRSPATARSWNGLIEVHYCDAHFEGAA